MYKSQAYGHGGSVVERAQHTTDILERAVLGATLAQRTRRLALEVDQVRVTLDDQHLTQVQVPMDADAQTAHRALGETRNMLRDGLTLGDQIVHQLLIIGTEVAFALFKQLQGSIPDSYTQVASCCLLYTSDAADEEDSVDLGGRRIIKKKKKNKKKKKKKQKKN